MRVEVHVGAERPSSFYARTVASIPREDFFVLDEIVYLQLEKDLGGGEAVKRWASDLATRLNRPILLNVPTARGIQTAAAGPTTWSRERLMGYVGAHHEDMELEFGPIARMRTTGPKEAA